VPRTHATPETRATFVPSGPNRPAHRQLRGGSKGSFADTQKRKTPSCAAIPSHLPRGTLRKARNSRTKPRAARRAAARDADKISLRKLDAKTHAAEIVGVARADCVLSVPRVVVLEEAKRRRTSLSARLHRAARGACHRAGSDKPATPRRTLMSSALMRPKPPKIFSISSRRTSEGRFPMYRRDILAAQCLSYTQFLHVGRSPKMGENPTRTL
jgi:hypothetical protein